MSLVEFLPAPTDWAKWLRFWRHQTLFHGIGDSLHHAALHLLRHLVDIAESGCHLIAPLSLQPFDVDDLQSLLLVFRIENDSQFVANAWASVYLSLLVGANDVEGVRIAAFKRQQDEYGVSTSVAGQSVVG